MPAIRSRCEAGLAIGEGGSTECRGSISVSGFRASSASDGKSGEGREASVSEGLAGAALGLRMRAVTGVSPAAQRALRGKESSMPWADFNRVMLSANSAAAGCGGASERASLSRSRREVSSAR